MALGRLLVGAVALGLIVLVRGRRRPAASSTTPALGWPTRSAWPRLLVVGVVWFAVYNLALNEAERRVDAGTAAMLVNVGPILIAVLAGLFLGEGFPRRLIAGVLVAFAGTVLIGVATSTGGAADLWGVVLCLVAAVAYAVGVVTQKPLLAKASGLHVTLIVTVIGAVACLPFAPALVDEIQVADPSTVAWLVYLGVGPTALGFLTWAYALARSSAGRLGRRHVPRTPGGRGAGVAAAGRDARDARAGRRGGLPRRRVHRPPPGLTLTSTGGFIVVP